MVSFSPSHFALQGTECSPGSILFQIESGLTWQSWLIPVSRSRGLLSPLLTDVVIGLLLNVTHYMNMPFILPDAPHRTDYSQSEGDQTKLHLTIKNFFPKKVIKKSINQFIYVNTWDEVVPIIRAQGSCMKRMKKYIMDFLYRFLSFNKQLF